MEWLHSSEITVTIGERGSVGHNTLQKKIGLTAAAAALLMAWQTIGTAPEAFARKAREKDAAKAVSPEKVDDRLQCILDTADPEFRSKYEAFLKSDPPDISSLPKGPLELGKGAYVTIEAGMTGEDALQRFRKILLTFPSENISDPIECDKKGFVMLADETAGLQVRTSAVEIVEGGVTSTSKAGYIFPASSTTTFERLRWICKEMSSHKPEMEGEGKKAKVARHENQERKSIVWFEPRPLPEKQILAADMNEDEFREEPPEEPMGVEMK